MSFNITDSDISALALGSSILACGGGGNPYYGMLIARDILAKKGPVNVIDIEDIEPDALVVMSVLMGAPLVGIEKPPSLIALRTGFKALKKSVGNRISAFVAGEVGGAQSVFPLILSALTGKPLLNGDGMGRAFPEAQMCTFLIYGITPGLPTAITDDHGLLLNFPPLPFGKIQFGGVSKTGRIVGLAIERIFRRYCARKGGLIYMTSTCDQPSLSRTLIRGSIRLALDIGREVEAARNKGDDPIKAILRIAGGRLLFQGKIGDVERRFRGGHDWGSIQIEGMDMDSHQHAEIFFKNEYLILKINDNVVLTVPDLITIVETQTGAPITSEVVRPGLRVSILGIKSSPLLQTPEALRVVNPKAFGYDIPFVQLQ